MASKTILSQRNLNLPNDWKLLELEEISEEIYRYPTYYNIEYVESGIPEVRGEMINNNGTLETDIKKYRFISSKTSCMFPRTVLKEGDFVISVRGTIGKVAIISKNFEGANITANLIRISPNRSIVFPLFLKFHFISESFQKIINNLSPQTTIKTIQAPLLKSIQITIPPLKEQQKIASILSNVDQLIQKTDQIIEQTQRLKKGLMQRLLTKGIGHTKFRKMESGEIPEEWHLSQISEIAELEMGQSPPGDSYNTKHGTPLLNGPTEFGLKYPTPIQFTTRPTKLCQIGDVLLCVRGSTTGRLNLSNGTYCIGRGLAAIRGIRNRTDTIWLYYHLVRLQNYIFNIASGGGSTFPNINRDFMEKIALPYPPLVEQQQIACILSNLDKLILEQQMNKSKIEILKRGLMQKLLTGKLRVKI